jgi:hypothetical protein
MSKTGDAWEPNAEGLVGFIREPTDLAGQSLLGF